MKTNSTMQLGMVGLGRMGANMVRRFLKAGHRFRQTIAAKIFGLAIFLLFLTIALASFLMLEVARTERVLKIVADLDVPLTKSVGQIEGAGLRRRLAFERSFGALNAAEPNREIVAEASTNYKLFTDKLGQEFANTRRLVDAYPTTVAGHETIAEIKTMLDQIEPAYQVISTRQRQVLYLQLAGQHGEANQHVNLL